MEDLALLSQWIAASRMRINVYKSSIMWFHIKPTRSRAPPLPI